MNDNNNLMRTLLPALCFGDKRANCYTCKEYHEAHRPRAIGTKNIPILFLTSSYCTLLMGIKSAFY